MTTQNKNVLERDQYTSLTLQKKQCSAENKLCGKMSIGSRRATTPLLLKGA